MLAASPVVPAHFSAEMIRVNAWRMGPYTAEASCRPENPSTCDRSDDPTSTTSTPSTAQLLLGCPAPAVPPAEHRPGFRDSPAQRTPFGSDRCHIERHAYLLPARAAPLVKLHAAQPPQLIEFHALTVQVLSHFPLRRQQYKFVGQCRWRRQRLLMLRLGRRSLKSFHG